MLGNPLRRHARLHIVHGVASRIVLRTVFLLAAVFLAGKSLAQITETESSMIATIDKRQPEARTLIEKVVNMNSGSMNFEGVKAVGDVFRSEFKELGFDTEWIDGSKFGRAGHLVARHGSRGPHFLMIGHLDTVFEPENPFQRFKMLSDKDASGPGVIDMKGGDVIILEVLHALKSVDLLDRMTITVILNGDEESSGRPLSVSRDVLIRAADEADIALGFEDGDGDLATAVISRRGYTDWQLRVVGTPAHSSQIFREDIGFGAIYEAARILTAFQETLSAEQYLTFNPGMIVGGTRIDYENQQTSGTAFGKSNVIAEHTLVAGDLRTLSIEQRDQAKEKMKAIVANHLPGTTAEITFDDGYPPLAPTDGNRTLLSLLDQASRDLGTGSVSAVDPSRAGAADISFTAGRVDMAIDGLGLMGDGGHTIREVADMTSLPAQTKRVAILMARLLSRAGTD